MIAKTTKFFKKHYLVISILLVSSVLRWALILRGGQFYFPDESRYGIAQDALVLLLDGKVKTALLTLLGELAHVGFKFTALIPAFFENKFGTTLALPAIFFSFFSILNLLLIWKIAIATDAPTKVANYALFIAASSQVLLYYSRHIFPYDEAMFFGLLALYVTLKNPNKPGASFLSGALSFLCLVTYNGYWVIAAFTLVVNIINGAKEKRWFWKRSTFLGLGFLTLLALLLLLCFLVGKDFLGDYDIYLQKITQGSFSEGWSLPFEYFWHAEHGLIVVVGLLIILALLHLKLKEKGNKILYIGLGGTLFVYLGLVIPSNFTHTFVVYARTARQLMPFLVLTTAYGLSCLQTWQPGGRWLANIVVAVIFVQAVWNYRLEYKLIYPQKFIQELQTQYPDFEISSKMMRFYAPLVCQNNGVLAINYHYIYTWPQSIPSVQGDLLMQAPHPVNFLPYQYDGFTPAERQAIRAEKIEMYFYKIDNSYLTSHKKDIENCYQVQKGK
jgi:hypothetical protein